MTTRPPNQPSTPPPPPRPKPPTTPSTPATASAADAIFAAVDQLYADLARPHKPAPPSKPPRKPINTKPIRLARTNLPARQVPIGDRVPDDTAVAPGGLGPNVPTASGGRGDGRAAGACGATTFDLPPKPKPPTFPRPRFVEGRDRLVGAVRMGGPSDGGEPSPMPPPPPPPLRHAFPLPTGP